jgi:methyl-accepting chemotaxis protein
MWDDRPPAGRRPRSDTQQLHEPLLLNAATRKPCRHAHGIAIGATLLLTSAYLLSSARGTQGSEVLATMPTPAAQTAVLPAQATDQLPAQTTVQSIAVQQLPLTQQVINGSFVIPPKCLYEMCGVALSGTALLAAVVAIAPALGFEAGGVEAESAAAAWHATIGDVEKRSLFASLQSLAARGQLLRILATGLPVVGGLAMASAAFCAKLEEIEDATAGTAKAITNMTSAALLQIKHASDDPETAEKLREAVDDVAETFKHAIANAASAAKDKVADVKQALDHAPWDEIRRWWDTVLNATSSALSHLG